MCGMPRQNTSPQDFPAFILQQIEQLALHIVNTRKQRGETQAQWAEKLGISQPTMARIERGDPAIATATYVTCLWMVNPDLNLLGLINTSSSTQIPPRQQEANPPAPASTTSAAAEFADLLSQWTAAIPS